MSTDPYASAQTFSFGDSPAMADGLLALVLAGTKTATCGALRDFPEGSPERPVVGRRDVVLDGQGRRAAVIETVEVTVRRFDEMDEKFAHDEGEGLRTLAEWREGHQSYFERNGGFSPDMELICERFRLVEVLPRTETEERAVS
ncbi:ASCH domain-containing protein [Arvimicrobium flavum]|uniref:ASCH domain-containing protein n=1 Tax=Arvimicrobium flavum TaxID=3393320 RepID=UPI00237B6AA2|nr:ASCH domain-containing protein [Mesorhizobium shangrilense]